MNKFSFKKWWKQTCFSYGGRNGQILFWGKRSDMFGGCLQNRIEVIFSFLGFSFFCAKGSHRAPGAYTLEQPKHFVQGMQILVEKLGEISQGCSCKRWSECFPEQFFAITFLRKPWLGLLPLEQKTSFRDAGNQIRIARALWIFAMRIRCWLRLDHQWKNACWLHKN